jgi:ADP-heptose:LPS heptosyltransferase
VIDLQGLLRSGLIAGATGARVRVGRADAREGSRRFYTHQVSSAGPETHAVDRLLDVAAALGADVSRPRFVVAKTSEDVQWARSVLEGVPRPVVALNPGARWLTKRWPPERFAEVARRAAARRGAGIVVVGAPEDRPLAEAILQALGTTPALDLCGRTRLPQLAALAGEVDVFLSNDTGPLHLAAAAGARTVGVYTCTSPGRTGPYGAASIAVQSCVWCSPSYIRNCDRLECMTELTSERVWKAVERQLSGGIMAA